MELQMEHLRLLCWETSSSSLDSHWAVSRSRTVCMSLGFPSTAVFPSAPSNAATFSLSLLLYFPPVSLTSPLDSRGSCLAVWRTPLVRWPTVSVRSSSSLDSNPFCPSGLCSPEEEERTAVVRIGTAWPTCLSLDTWGRTVTKAALLLWTSWLTLKEFWARRRSSVRPAGETFSYFSVQCLSLWVKKSRGERNKLLQHRHSKIKLHSFRIFSLT